MGEDGEAESKGRRQRLLSRFTRGRGDQDGQAKDVADFLKPSTEKSTALPRINVALAQRFPDAQGLKTRADTFDRQADANQLRKRRRRDGLRVRFAEQPPEIIGEGGDESPYAPAQISSPRNAYRAADPRFDHGRFQPESRYQPEYTHAGAERQDTEQQKLHPELSEQHRQYERPSAAFAPPYTNDPTLQQLRRTTMSPAVSEKGRAMRVNEGMALRRGSAYMDDFYEDDDNDLHDDHDPPLHFQPRNNDLAPAYKAPPFPRHRIDTKLPLHTRTRSSEMQTHNTTVRSPDTHSLQVMHPRVQPVYAASQQKEPQSAVSSTGSDSALSQGRYPGQAQYRAYKPPSAQVPTRPSPRTSVQALPGAYETFSGALPTSPKKSSRPSSISSITATSRSTESIHPRNQPSAGEVALTDFATRVAHMKGVFALTAEREKPAEIGTPDAWLRVACWWYIEGKIELEQALRRRARSTESPRELLLQGHVDLAKSWWILGRLTSQPDQSRSLSEECGILLEHLQSLCLAIGKSRIMPPPASLIQGQDTRIWLSYPAVDDESTAVLGGTVAIKSPRLSATQVLPMADTHNIFCYNWFRVHVGIGNYNASNHQTLPCLLSVVRDTRTFQNSLIIASQLDIVSIVIGASSGAVEWESIEWHVKDSVLSYHYDEQHAVTIYLQDQDFRLLRSMIDYTRKAVHMLRPKQDEHLVLELKLLSVRYSDSSKSRIFPKDRVKDCQVSIFEREVEGVSTWRLAVVTSPSTKILSCINHQLHQDRAILYETMLRQDGGEVPAMRLYLHDDGRDAEMQLEFAKMTDLHEFCAAITGCLPSSVMAVLNTVVPVKLAINLSSSQPGISYERQDPLQTLQWRRIAVIASTEQPSLDAPMPSGPRLAIQHTGGYFAIPLTEMAGQVCYHIPHMENFSLQIMTRPELGITASLDMRHISTGIRDLIDRKIHDIQDQPKVLTIALESKNELHMLQSALLGYEVLFDEVASSVTIARRKLGISTKYTATGARVQLLYDSSNATYTFVAFLPDLEVAEVVCFEIKPTDVFEQTKGDGKSKKWAVKLADVHFNLPLKVDEENKLDATKRRYACLADAAATTSEHGDITVGFDTEAECDVFVKILPAATKISRLATFRKRG